MKRSVDDNFESNFIVKNIVFINVYFQDSKVASTASTNLSFLYFLQGDLEQAERYAEHARTTDSYNAAAFVNLGNCCYQKGDIEKAKEMFQVRISFLCFSKNFKSVA